MRWFTRMRKFAASFLRRGWEADCATKTRHHVILIYICCTKRLAVSNTSLYFSPRLLISSYCMSAVLRQALQYDPKEYVVSYFVCYYYNSVSAFLSKTWSYNTLYFSQTTPLSPREPSPFAHLESFSTIYQSINASPSIDPYIKFKNTTIYPLLSITCDPTLPPSVH